MSAALQFLAPRVPLVDPRTGLMSREWFLLFQAIWERAGGTTGPSTPALQQALQTLSDGTTATTEELGTALQALADEVAAQTDAAQQSPAMEPLPLPDDQAPATLPAPAQTDDPSAELSALREELAALRRRVHDIEQGLIP
jgi:hypothetical protein